MSVAWLEANFNLYKKPYRFRQHKAKDGNPLVF